MPVEHRMRDENGTPGKGRDSEPVAMIIYLLLITEVS